MIDWSYDRLTESERALLRRLSAFMRGWSLEAAEAICGHVGFAILDFGLPTDQNPVRNPKSPVRNSTVLELLSRLVSKSLVLVQSPSSLPTPNPRHPTPKPETRYHLLETIRQYAAERLQEAGEAEALRQRHSSFFLGLAEAAEPELTGPAQATWLARLDADYDNLRAALEWSLRAKSGVQGASTRCAGTRQSDGPERLNPALRLAGALGRYWQIRGLFTEGREFLMRALARSEDGEPLAEGIAARAKALSWASFLAVYQGDYSLARTLCEGSLVLWREVGDKRGIAGALGCLAIIAKDHEDAQAAEGLFMESLALWRELEDPAGIAGTLGYLGILAADREEYSSARALYEESLALRRRLGDHWGIAASLNNLGLLALNQGDEALARPLLEESLAIRRQLGDRRCMAVSLNSLGQIATSEGDYARARECLEESLKLGWEIGERRSIAYSLEALARLAAAASSAAQAARLCGAAEALREQIGAPLSPAARTRLEAVIAAARTALGENTFAAAWAEGRALPLDQAVTAALAGLHDT
jgi:tetratricopeptide (TPR) repeat protein